MRSGRARGSLQVEFLFSLACISMFVFGLLLVGELWLLRHKANENARVLATLLSYGMDAGAAAEKLNEALLGDNASFFKTQWAFSAGVQRERPAEKFYSLVYGQARGCVKPAPSWSFLKDGFCCEKKLVHHRLPLEDPS